MLDYLDLAADLDDESRAWRDRARAFVDEAVRPDVADDYLEGRFPDELVTAMGDAGLYGPNLETDAFDSPNIGPRAYGLLMQELEACDSGLRSMASVQGALVMGTIAAYGSPEQRERWLADMATGEAVGCFALTEPEHGSNPAGMETVAEREGEYVLSGAKRWSTNAPIADVAVVWARDRSREGNPVRGFLVETDRAGVDVGRIEGKLSLRASISGELTLDAARGEVLPGTDGLGSALARLTAARYGIAWGAVGAARDCFETAREYALEREQFGRPIAGFQLQQGKLADMATGITTAQLLAHRLADLKERGDLRPQQVSMGKRENVRVAQRVARTAREMLGGEGITSAYSPMRHLANLESVATYEGTDDIHALILGEDLTGISAFE